MKREDMLSKIETLLNNLSGIRMSNKMKSHLILTELEKEGMQPPKNARYIKELEFEGLIETSEWEWDGYCD